MSNLNTRSTSGIRKARDFGHDEEFDQIRIRKKSRKVAKQIPSLYTDSDSGNDDDLKLSISKSENSSRNVDVVVVIKKVVKMKREKISLLLL